LPWDEFGGCLHVLAKRLSGAKVARARYQAPVRNVGIPRFDVFGLGVDVAGVRENSKRRKPQGGEYRCGAGRRTAS
jgi:hypothetical protein